MLQWTLCCIEQIDWCCNELYDSNFNCQFVLYNQKIVGVFCSHELGCPTFYLWPNKFTIATAFFGPLSQKMLFEQVLIHLASSARVG